MKLPIVILRWMDYDSGMHTVAGSKANLFTIHRVLGYVDLNWEAFASWQPLEDLVLPRVQLLHSTLSFTTALIIVMGVIKEKKIEQDLGASERQPFHY